MANQDTTPPRAGAYRLTVTDGTARTVKRYDRYEDAAGVLALLRDHGKDGLAVTLEHHEHGAWRERATVRTGGAA
jgi:hypothetical protein